MKLDEIVAWYQKKIGTYDKQQWEKTVEQKILDGFSSVTLKTAKLKTQLIDVDLVRGSTFPKAKPKQSLLTVIRLAIQRYFLLPVYAQWWVKQTSPNAFALLFCLYILQMINWAVYTYNTNHGGGVEIGATLNSSLVSNVSNVTVSRDGGGGDGSADVAVEKEANEEHIVSISDLLIPMALSLLLSLIHSQIVATNTLSGVKTKRRRISNATSTGSNIAGKMTKEPRMRRRKKLVKVRSQDQFTDATAQQRKAIVAQNLKKSNILEQTEKSLESTQYETQRHNNPPSHLNIPSYRTPSNAFLNGITPTNYPAKLTLDLKNTVPATDEDSLLQPAASSSNDCLIDSSTHNSSNNHLANKKRNVNWQSPIQIYAIETQEKQQQTSPQTPQTSSSETNTPNNAQAAADGAGGATAGFTSSSSGNNSHLGTPSKTVRIHDGSIQEFYEDLMTRADELLLPPMVPTPARMEAQAQAVTKRRTIGEDDGFESLNGKSSSGEETNASLMPTTSATSLRLRLNAARDGEVNSTTYRRKVPLSSESDADKIYRPSSTCDAYQQTKKPRALQDDVTTDQTDEDGDDVETISSPASLAGNNSNYTECTTSATEWLGVTTNSEECSYSSELDNTDDFNKAQQYTDEDGYEQDFTPATILNPHGFSDRISCTIWEQRDIKKAQMSVLEISSCIIERVESMPETNDYIYLGIVFSLLLSLVPTFCRLCEVTLDTDKSNELSYWDLPMLLWEKASFSCYTLFHFAFGHTQWERTVLIISLVQRFCLTMIIFMIFAVAERTFKQRFLYAKLFSHLTSSRRARKSNLPHFRLNKVRNIKTWLCVRSYLKKRGPQRSVDVIVSAAFIVTHLLLAFLSLEWLKDSVHLHTHLNLEALMWSSTVGIFLLRFMTLGNKIHTKYRSVSVLITEQINLYLQIEQKPKKKDELMVSNSVLKLAADLLKELESPFKISGLRANPYLFTTLKVVILSALSGVLSEMLGFKLKLLKIKIK